MDERFFLSGPALLSPALEPPFDLANDWTGLIKILTVLEGNCSGNFFWGIVRCSESNTSRSCEMN